MNEHVGNDRLGVVTAPRTVRIERILPGPVERVWAYLTESDKRKKWLAARPDGRLCRRRCRTDLLPFAAYRTKPPRPNSRNSKVQPMKARSFVMSRRIPELYVAGPQANLPK